MKNRPKQNNSRNKRSASVEVLCSVKDDNEINNIVTGLHLGSEEIDRLKSYHFKALKSLDKTLTQGHRLAAQMLESRLVQTKRLKRKVQSKEWLRVDLKKGLVLLEKA